MNGNKKETIIDFPKGIPGFENHKRFKIIEDDSLLASLVSMDDSEVRFIFIRSQLMFPNYLSKVELAEEEAKLLEIAEEDTLEIWSLLTLCQTDIHKTTVNLRAPILINRRTGKGAQFILDDDRYSTRYPLLSSNAESQTVSNEKLQGRG